MLILWCDSTFWIVEVKNKGAKRRCVKCSITHRRLAPSGCRPDYRGVIAKR